MLKALLMVVLLDEQDNDFFYILTSARAGDHLLVQAITNCCALCAFFAAQQFHNISGYYFTYSVTVITFTKFHAKKCMHRHNTDCQKMFNFVFIFRRAIILLGAIAK